MTLKSKSFSDTLTPGQVQKVLTALGIPWQKYNPDKNGWITVDSDDFEESGYVEYSVMGINVYHGGFADHSMHGQNDGIKGDIVRLVQLIYYEDIFYEYTGRAIKWIKNVTGISLGEQPPELGEDFQFANDWLMEKNKHNFVRMPNDILHSNLSASAKIVWMEVFRRVGKDEIYSFAGIRNISEKTTLSKSTVQRAMDELVSTGLIIQKPSGHNRRMNRYPTVSDLNTLNHKMRQVTEIDNEVYS